ncbi:MAG: UDP-3-O-acyl-N-acetylglucosamine deacetylase [Candidatus Omnitrophica bacterium]|nr:UDP-3-O-acyl-N-acetylglucosamine deacetylase [Candidatus Omnitrophota bacterium]MCF7876989.1 UDP-3-O-acyl-N-acetylglucosamine deacetylase [Candidatus Omnitrophota bacterium]MCF7878509.1 UDP-3-O-acyl-N-acetylglucosamine deacetylase [Candidatus Omnitrophota bacterium]MCF7893162.1 UDP-3-O-acyl-N-acetylglucosamine deacetylase [Candidatus Omnitrophota bacterium]
MDKQKTIKGKFHLEGKGLHTGEEAKLEFLPASAGSGIVFIKQDVNPPALIKGDFYSVGELDKFPRRTSIGSGENYIQTVEHLMASLSILGIDNIQINIWGNEVPGLDGSSKEFVEKIKKAGLIEQEGSRDTIVVKEPLWIEEGESSIVLLPSNQFRVSYGLDYNSSKIGSGFADIVVGEDKIDNFYQARTFCLKNEVDKLLEMGLGKGANYKNTLVVSEQGVVDNELRFPDEFIKHKILDLVGDLYLAGPLKAHVVAVRSGHSLNIRLLKKLRRYKQKRKSAAVGSSCGYIPDKAELNTEEVMKILPHRYPFLLVDKVVELDRGKRAVGIKSVTMNEYFFQGHFPGKPVMPGVLLVEAMAQVGGVLMLACPEHRGKLAYFMAAEKVKFRKTVLPGDQLVMEVLTKKIRSRTGKVTAKAKVSGKVVAEAELMFSLV